MMLTLSVLQQGVDGFFPCTLILGGITAQCPVLNQIAVTGGVAYASALTPCTSVGMQTQL